MGDNLGRWLAVSLVVHLAVSGGYLGYAAGAGRKPTRPVIYAKFVPLPGKGTGALTTPPAPPAPAPAAVTPPPVPAPKEKPKEQVKTVRKEQATKKVPARDAKKVEKPAPEPAKPKGHQDERTGGHKGRIESPAAPASALPGGGSASIGVDAPDFTYSYFLVTIQNAIAREWNAVGAAAHAGDLYAVVYFQIERDGRIVRPEIESSSGDALFDQAAVRAVQRASLPPLPAEFAESLLGIHFQFEYAP